jgi:hypothetical protein
MNRRRYSPVHALISVSYVEFPSDPDWNFPIPSAMMMNMAEENWKRLGDYVVARRTALGMRDRRALSAVTGVTDRTLGKVETGRRVSASTLGVLENHLGWAPGSCRSILAGGEPIMSAPSPAQPAHPADSGIPHYDDPTLQHIAEVPGLPPEVVRGLIALARNWREQEDEQDHQEQRRA